MPEAKRTQMQEEEQEVSTAKFLLIITHANMARRAVPWLAQTARIRNAELRLLVSSYPLVPTELGRDAWGNFPLERQRLFDLIEETKANGVIVLSGDVHFAEISRTGEGPYPLYDFTSSAVTAPSVGNENFTNKFRISATYKEVNFGLVEIDWRAQPTPRVSLKAVGLDGVVAFEHTVSVESLRKE